MPDPALGASVTNFGIVLDPATKDLHATADSNFFNL